MARRPTDPDSVQMTFGEHLEELRRRLIFGLVGFAVVCCATLYYGRDITFWLCQPLLSVQRQAGLAEGVYNFSVVGSFMAYMKVAMVTALILSGPWMIYQLWRFVEAGLYSAERRLIVLMGPTCALLTALSIAFTYYVLIPGTVAFLIQFSVTFPTPKSTDNPVLDRMVRALMKVNDASSSFSYRVKRPTTTAPSMTQPDLGTTFVQPLPADPVAPLEGQTWLNTSDGQLKVCLAGQVRTMTMSANSLMTPLIGIDEYLSLVLTLAVIMALAFQIPVVLGLAGGLGLVTAQQLGKYRLYVLFGLFVLGLFVTPSQDLFSNILIPLVMYSLFEIGLIFMRLTSRKTTEPEETEEQA
ncbi:MAG: twin-arginine translocase subunit TatC [Planctomycetota bacterium]|nr:twin-arginine translocase subunit TatC [Planctomycetota bacterium]